LGFFPISKVLLNFDVAGGIYNSGKSYGDSLILGINPIVGDYSSQSLSIGLRGASVSAHLAIQANPWRNLILSTSGLLTIRKDLIGVYTYDGRPAGYTNGDRRVLSSAGIGWKLKPNLIAEYLMSIDHSDRVPSHSLRLRYTFDLGITREK